MAIDRSLVSGSMGMLILRLLSEKDMYGYEMIDTLKKRSENVFELRAGTLYPLLHGLEEKQFLNSYEQEVLGKVRKYYQITPEGRKKRSGRNTQKQSAMFWRWRCKHENGRIPQNRDRTGALQQDT